MADSASDPKVEDVLSSVRRLVSGEIPRKTRAPVPKGPGALVLTDEDRIKKDPPARNAARSLEQRIAELEAAVDNVNDEFEPDGSEDQAQNIPDRIVYTRPPSSEEEAQMRTLRLSEIALIPTEPATDDGDDVQGSDAPVAFRHEGKPMSSSDEIAAPRIGHNGPPMDDDEDLSPISEGDAEGAPMAVDVPTEPRKRAEVAVFSNPDDVVERIEARIDNGEDPKSDVPIAVVSQPDAADTQAEAQENMLREDVVDPDDAEEPATKDDFDTALNAAVEASVASAVFEELATDPPSFMAEQDDGNPSDSLEAVQSEDTDAGPIVSAALPDKDALRKMVAQLMREELQGELGERITRNVRKLVRREIKRALAARDLF